MPANNNEKLALINVLKDWAIDVSAGFTAIEADINKINVPDDMDSIAASQSPTGAESLTLTGSDPEVARKLNLYSPDDCSGVTFDITGTDINGDPQTETGVTGPNAGTVATEKFWKTVTDIAASGACTNISVGIGEIHVTPINKAYTDAKTFKTSGVPNVTLDNAVASISAEASA